MSMHVVMLRHVAVNLHGSPTVKIKLPDSDTGIASTSKEREKLEQKVLESVPWVRTQIEEIKRTGKGLLADDEHPMRSFGAGILARLPGKTVGLQGDWGLVLNIRGSNRGSVWPLGHKLTDVFCWKEFAGVTSSAAELRDPRPTAIKELYEEIAFLAHDEVLLPDNIQQYPDSEKQVGVGIDRANRHYGFHLTPRMGGYPEVTFNSLQGDSGATVQINEGEPFQAVVNYGPGTNALEISFVVDIAIEETLTGILSLAGPEETTNLTLPPYMEDVVVVRQTELVKAQRGLPVPVKHLLSVHGPTNLDSPERTLVYAPAVTLVPLVWHLAGEYSFRRVLENA